jgi:hypothetical protein
MGEVVKLQPISVGSWIKHDGKSVPEIDGLRCDMKLRSGEIMGDENSQDWWDSWLWSNRHKDQWDVIEYREST